MSLQLCKPGNWMVCRCLQCQRPSTVLVVSGGAGAAQAAECEGTAEYTVARAVRPAGRRAGVGGLETELEGALLTREVQIYLPKAPQNK